MLKEFFWTKEVGQREWGLACQSNFYTGDVIHFRVYELKFIADARSSMFTCVEQRIEAL